jgi:hypothetical protein
VTLHARGASNRLNYQSFQNQTVEDGPQVSPLKQKKNGATRAPFGKPALTPISTSRASRFKIVTGRAIGALYRRRRSFTQIF